MAAPDTYFAGSPDASLEYGFAPEENMVLEHSWDSSPNSRSRTESNSTPNPVQKVSNWIKNNKETYPESSTLGSDCNECKSDKGPENDNDFMFFRYDLDKSRQHQKEDSDINCDPGFYDLPKIKEKDVQLKSVDTRPKKKSKLKGRRKSEGAPLTDTVLESDATSYDVPLSPESEQKRELCSYLQLMKPSDKKQVILLQNRRSTRVKNLCLLQERRELEKKLKEEEEQSHVNGQNVADESEKYLGLKSFKELNIRLDRTWLTNHNPEKTWLEYKKKGFEFPKPPSDFGKDVDDFENTSFVKEKEKPVQNGNSLSEVIQTTPKSSKVKQKSKKTTPLNIKKKLNILSNENHHKDKNGLNHTSQQVKTPKTISKESKSQNSAKTTKRRSSETAINVQQRKNIVDKKENCAKLNKSPENVKAVAPKISEVKKASPKQRKSAESNFKQRNSSEHIEKSENVESSSKQRNSSEHIEKSEKVESSSKQRNSSEHVEKSEKVESSSKQRNSSEHKEKSETTESNGKPFAIPKPLSILNDLTVDFDVVMEKKIDILKKTIKRNDKKIKMKKKDKHREKKHKSGDKRKNRPKALIKIKLFPSKSKKRKLISDIMDSLNSGTIVKKPKLTTEGKEESTEIKKKKDKSKKVKVVLNDKAKTEKKKKIIQISTPNTEKTNDIFKRKVLLNVKVKTEKKKKKIKISTPNTEKTNEVFKENKKPETNKEKNLSDKLSKDKDAQKSFTNLFSDTSKLTCYKRSPTPTEHSDFIDEHQFNLLSEEHQRILMQSRIPIMPKLTQFSPSVNRRTISTTTNEFIQDFSDNISKKPMDKLLQQYDNHNMSDDANSVISEGELQGFASDEQEFFGFNLPTPSTKGRMSIKLHLSPDPSSRSSKKSEPSSCSIPAANKDELYSTPVQGRLESPNKDKLPLERFNKDIGNPLRVEVEEREQTIIVPFRKVGETNSLVRSLTSPRRYQGFKTNFEVQHSPQGWVPDSPSQKPKKNQHSIFISPENGGIIKAFYIEYNLVLCQESAVSFWTQTALGHVLGAQNMWISKGTIQRLVMGNKCVFKESPEMVVSTETNLAYIELWMKEHESNLRQRPVADVFATIYFWKKGQKAIEKKVLQLENINGFADDVQYSVLKYTSKIIVSWHTAGTQIEHRTTNVHCYTLAADYQTVSNITEFESVEHYVSSLHNVEDCEGLIMGCGDNRITLWNVEYGYIVATVTMTDIKSPLCTLWAKCDRGFLFTLQQCVDRELRMIAIKGMDGSWKKLASYLPPPEYDRLKGVCVENGLVLAIYDQGIQCWNAKTGESVVEETQSDTGHISGKYIITVVNDQVHVRHAVTHLLSLEDL